MTRGPIVVINPNSSVAMTQTMLSVARAAAPDAAIVGWTSYAGPPAIQGEADGDRAIPPLLGLVRRASEEGASAIVIGCFDDTGLAEATRLAACPVIGIGQAAYREAVRASDRFSVVTTLDVSVPVIERNIHGSGLAAHLGRVRASGIPVLDLEGRPAEAVRRLRKAVEMAAREDGVGAIVLGCAGMGPFVADLRKSVSQVIVDGVEAAACLAAGLVSDSA